MIYTPMSMFFKLEIIFFAKFLKSLIAMRMQENRTRIDCLWFSGHEIQEPSSYGVMDA